MIRRASIAAWISDWKVARGEHRSNPRDAQHRRLVNRHNARGGVRTAHEAHMQGSAQQQIVGEAQPPSKSFGRVGAPGGALLAACSGTTPDCGNQSPSPTLVSVATLCTFTPSAPTSVVTVSNGNGLGSGAYHDEHTSRGTNHSDTRREYAGSGRTSEHKTRSSLRAPHESQGLHRARRVARERVHPAGSSLT
jgi:hypothetical protein